MSKMKNIYPNIGIVFILLFIIGLSLGMFSPCFQGYFLEDKNLYEYITE